MSLLKERLIHLMKENDNISTLKLSKKTNIPQPTLHHIISGKTLNPRKSVQESLAYFFGITINQLTGKEELKTLITKQEIENNNIAKYIPLVLFEGEPDERTLLVDNEQNYNLAVILNTDDYAPLFIQNSILIGTIGKEALNDRNYIFIKETNNSRYLAKVIMENESIFIIKLKTKNLEKEIIPLDEIKFSILLSIKETRNKL